MGKTGSIEWVKVKGRKGQVRQVAKAETVYKKPGPMQRYSATGSRVKKIKRSAKATQIRTGFPKVQAYWEANLAYCAEINPDYGKQGKARNVILLAFITGLGGVGTNLFAKDETWGFISIHLIFRVVSIIMGFLFRYFVEFHESKGLPVISGFALRDAKERLFFYAQTYPASLIFRGYVCIGSKRSSVRSSGREG